VQCGEVGGLWRRSDAPPGHVESGACDMSSYQGGLGCVCVCG
jgi:hypothetical protein